MNLFINDVRVTDLKPYLDEIKDVFPLFFDKNNPKPIRLTFVDELFTTVVKRRGTRGSSFKKKQAPLPQNIKTISYRRNDTGTSDMIVLTNEFPVANQKTGHLQYRKPFIRIADGDVLVPGRDEVKLIWMYFFSSSFTNGKKTNPRGDFRFDMPEVNAKARIENEKEIHELKSGILFSGISHVMVQKVLNAVGLEVTSIEELNRTTLFDYLNQNQSARTVYYNILESEVDSGKLADALTLIREAISREKLHQTPEGWRTMNKTGLGLPFCPADPTTPLEHLAKVCVDDPRTYRKIEKALETELV